jgi:hypothetical protein
MIVDQGLQFGQDYFARDLNSFVTSLLTPEEYAPLAAAIEAGDGAKYSEELNAIFADEGDKGRFYNRMMWLSAYDKKTKREGNFTNCFWNAPEEGPEENPPA